jgi:hypothetical protein
VFRGHGQTAWSILVAATMLALGLGIDPASASDRECPPGNLLLGAAVDARGASGDPQLITDGLLYAEGAPWDVPVAVVLRGTDARLIIDAGKSRTWNALLIQADHDDRYRIDGSLDGWNWQPLWAAPAVGGGGLRIRTARLPRPAQARYLRVQASGGDGRYSISEVRAFCQVPERTESRRINPRDPTSRWWFSLYNLGVIKAATALLGLLLFLWGIALRRAGAGEFDRKPRDVILIVLGTFSLLLYFNLGQFNIAGFVRHYEFYHYQVNAKYFDELGYTRLYMCTTIADAEDVVPGLERRRVRDLENNRIGSPREILADPGKCRSHFSDERWEEFKQDIRWYRSHMSQREWELALTFHGANASPVWQLYAGPLASLAPVGDGFILGLALVDLLLLVIMWVCVVWAFDWRAACVAALWWGTNYPAIFDWVGGAYLRQDWLVLAVIGVCLVRREKQFVGGILLTCATLIRVLPGFIVAALVLKALITMVRERRLLPAPAHRRFALGCLLALGLLVPTSMLATGGAGTWTQFVRNSAVYLKTQGTNGVGLKTVLSYDPASRMEVARDPALEDPDQVWSAARDAALERRGWIRWTVTLAFLVLLGLAVHREADWVALALGIGLIPIASAPASYYFAVFLGIGLLWDRLGNRIGALLAGLALLSQLVYLVWPANIESDERFVWVSLCVVLFAWWLVLLVWRTGRGSRPGPRAGLNTD